MHNTITTLRIRYLSWRVSRMTRRLRRMQVRRVMARCDAINARRRHDDVSPEKVVECVAFFAVMGLFCAIAFYGVTV